MSFLAPVTGHPVRLLALFGFALLLLAAAACGDDDDDGGAPTATGSTPTPTARETRTAEPTLVESVCTANPDPAALTELRVFTPARGDSPATPLEIVGTAGTAPAALRATLYNEAGAAIAESAAVGVEENDAQFSLSLDFSVAGETPACLWVYKVGEGDAPENIVQIALALVTEETPRGVCGPNPEPAAQDVVRVDEPGPEDQVSSPLTVSGGIVLTSGELTLTLYDEDGGEIAQDTASAGGGGGLLAPFQSALAFEVSEQTEACLWVWEAKDGAALNVAQVPVTLLP